MRWLVITFVIAGCTTTPQQTPATDRLACYGCHQTEYETAPQSVSACVKKPVHDPALGYTTNCYTCHGATAPAPSPDPNVTLAGWCPAVDPMTDPKHHDVFLISKGSHAGFDCRDCHVALPGGQTLTSAAAPQPIECTTCHWHDKGLTDPRHLGNGSYKYGPSTCLADGCHGGGQRQ
ncbi:MAG: hypothetical protein JO257_10225 [Deltaproteobacteria bacterium]|nr:hypothetical protein [Deltaproteobacteria bacterium]